MFMHYTSYSFEFKQIRQLCVELVQTMPGKLEYDKGTLEALL